MAAVLAGLGKSEVSHPHRRHLSFGDIFSKTFQQSRFGEGCRKAAEDSGSQEPSCRRHVVNASVSVVPSPQSFTVLH